MADQSTHNSTFEELEKYFNEEESRRMLESRNETPCNANESASSTFTTPDPLNTAFINETDVSETNSQSSLSQQQSQTTKEASSIIHGLIDRISKQEHEVIDVRTPTKTTMTSTSTMPKTPIMVSTGTMPRTPAMKSTGTMPMTPTMKSTGTMPKTPTMISTGTMPRTPITTVSPSGNVTIDLCSPDASSTIDLCSPDTPTNTGSPK